MARECPFCELEVVGDQRIFELHIMACSAEDAKRKLKESGWDIDLDLLFSNIHQVKKFTSFFEAADEYTQGLMYTCSRCFRYGLNNIGARPKTCSCGGEIIGAKDFIESILVDEKDTPR